MAKGKRARFPNVPEGSTIEYLDDRAVAWYPRGERVEVKLPLDRAVGSPSEVDAELWALLKPGARFELLSDGWAQVSTKTIHVAAVVDETVVVYRTWNTARRKWLYDLESVAMLNTLWESGHLKAVGDGNNDV